MALLALCAYVYNTNEPTHRIRKHKYTHSPCTERLRRIHSNEPKIVDGHVFRPALTERHAANGGAKCQMCCKTIAQSIHKISFWGGS